MSVASSTWQTHLSAIIAHPTEPSVLLLPDDNVWKLPYIRFEKRLWTPETAQVNQAIQQSFGLDCTVLRCAWTNLDREAQQLSVLYVLEQRDRAWTPPAEGRWVGRDTLDDLALAVPEQRGLLLEYFDDRGSELRPPWAQPGWFAAAEQWIQQQLTQRGYRLVAPIEQIKNAGISCILRSRTTTGDVYFKVASRRPLFVDEPALMAALAAEHPAYIPAPLAIESAQGWMLLADVGSELRERPTPQIWETALRLHSQIQQSFADRAETLLKIGCLDRRLERLVTQVDALLRNTEVLARFTDEEVRQIQRLAPRVPQMCQALASYAVPQTLVHGDLHGSNIALRDDRYLIFDWTDAALAHPFFDLVTIVDDARACLGQESAESLREGYLAQWTSYASLDRLREVWAIADPLGGLHQAVSYHHIVESLESSTKHEVVGGLTHFLRQALKSLPAEFM